MCPGYHCVWGGLNDLGGKGHRYSMDLDTPRVKTVQILLNSHHFMVTPLKAPLFLSSATKALHSKENSLTCFGIPPLEGIKSSNNNNNNNKRLYH